MFKIPFSLGVDDFDPATTTYVNSSVFLIVITNVKAVLVVFVMLWTK